MARIKEQGGVKKSICFLLQLLLLSFFASCFISRAAENKNPVRQYFFALKCTETLDIRFINGFMRTVQVNRGTRKRGPGDPSFLPCYFHVHALSIPAGLTISEPETSYDGTGRILTGRNWFLQFDVTTLIVKIWTLRYGTVENLNCKVWTPWPAKFLYGKLWRSSCDQLSSKQKGWRTAGSQVRKKGGTLRTCIYE